VHRERCSDSLLAYLTHLTQNEQNEEARDFEKSINSKSAAIFY
jgi:hypothetical protein